MSYSQHSKWAFRATSSKELPFNTKANQKWGKEAEWIHGEGPYASLCYCPSGNINPCLTIQLYDTLEDAVKAQFNLHCGGKCKDYENPNRTDWHQIWDLSASGCKQVDKQALEGKFIPKEQYEQAAQQARADKAINEIASEILRNRPNANFPAISLKQLFDAEEEAKKLAEADKEVQS